MFFAHFYLHSIYKSLSMSLSLTFISINLVKNRISNIKRRSLTKWFFTHGFKTETQKEKKLFPPLLGFFSSVRYDLKGQT